MKIFNNDTVAEMINGELILIDFESIETEFKHPNMHDNLKEFEALPDEKKSMWFEEYKENFLMHHDPQEWDQFYEEAKFAFEHGRSEIEIENKGQKLMEIRMEIYTRLQNSEPLSNHLISEYNELNHEISMERLLNESKDIDVENEDEDEFEM